ncbi:MULTISPECIES: ABC transporter permease [unclassified Achromobacter]|uniref:ABC transporter permease n=1 Tax=unclassified Achromobacter TaxID=2626865 RepID=UPI000B516A34|nr:MULTISPECIES: ABC transporter permease subunit [unclassified Achromobacter]OWT77124.1 nitrate ABC transporter permease [Achromobacter sp. HZ28]OWT78005.1 nitrate ABC transporter permease [Achromobacter sp. HZ34]
MTRALAPALPRAGYALAAVASLLCAWQAMAAVAHSPLVPGLPDIWHEVVRIVGSGQLSKNLLATLGRVASGFVLAFLTAFALALGMGRRRGLAAFFEPLLIVGLTVPGLVWAILCIIWFGISLVGSAIAVAISIAPAISLNLIQGVRSINAELLEVAAMLRLPLSVRLRQLWLPGLLPVVFSGARLALSLAWKVIVLVEMFGLSIGVGFQLNSEFGAQNVAGVLAWTLCFAVVMAILEYGLLAPLEAHLLRWRRVAAV